MRYVSQIFQQYAKTVFDLIVKRTLEPKPWRFSDRKHNDHDDVGCKTHVAIRRSNPGTFARLRTESLRLRVDVATRLFQNLKGPKIKTRKDSRVTLFDRSGFQRDFYLLNVYKCYDKKKKKTISKTIYLHI